MKKLFIFIFLLSLAGSVFSQGPVNLIVIFGESNASGEAPNASPPMTAAELAARNNTQIWNDNANSFQAMQIGVNNQIKQGVNPTNVHGFENGLANAVDASGTALTRPTYLIKIGSPGARCINWIQGGTPQNSNDGWTVLVARMNAAIAWLNSHGITYKLTVWISIGINDFNQGTTNATYLSQMNTIRSDFRGLYGSTTPFIATLFFASHPYNVPIQSYADNDPQHTSVAVFTDDAPRQPDGAHWTYDGYKTVAARLVTNTPVAGSGPAGQTMAFTAIPFSNADLNRPFGGVQGYYDKNVVNIPSAGTNTQRFDVYERLPSNTVMPVSSPEGTYDFSQFVSFINGAIDKGQKVALGTMPAFGGGPSLSVGGANLYYPLWAHTAMQASGQPDVSVCCDPFASGTNMWIPNYANPIWITRVRKAYHVAFNNLLMTGSHNGIFYRDIVNYIDIVEYADYGEWATLHGANPGTAALDSLINGVVLSYPNFQCMGQGAMLDGGTISGFVNTPIAVGAYALSISNNKGKIGFSDLCLGCTDGYRDRWLGAGSGNPNTYTFPGTGQFANTVVNFQSLLSTRYQIAPFNGEPPGFDPNGDNLADLLPATIRRKLNIIENGNINNDNPVQTGTLANNLRAASKQAGWRILLTAGSVTSAVSGGPVTISLTYQNAGQTPNYEHWNAVYEVMNGATVIKTLVSSFDPYLFLPGTKSMNETFQLTGVPAGTYRLRLRIIDPKGYRAPMPLAVTGVDANGGYTLIPSFVVNASSGPIAYAGLTQTIQLPTSSVVLSGSGSTGATSYSWTRVSGPNTPTIVTSTGVTTNVTGLIAGTYVFQLSINGGVSTSQVTINVNAIPVGGTTIFTTQAPADHTDNDGGGINYTTGLKFRSSVAGNVTGVRFYKTTGNTGTHTGLLYNSTGTQLASVVFTGETSLGWQTMAFSSPVAITPNTTYVIALFNSSGNYTEDQGYFNAVSVVNGPLTALADGVDGCNAPFNKSVSATPTFPATCFQQDNYWVDLTFDATSTPPGTANAGLDQIITLPTNFVTLSAATSTGVGNTYTWSKVSGPNNPTFGTINGVTTTVSGLIAGTYVFRVTLGTGSPDDVTVTVNAAPTVIANAGTDQAITLPVSSVTLDASASIGATTYLWSIGSGPAGAVITSTTSATTTVTGMVAGVYVFALDIVGGPGGSIHSADFMSVVVNPGIVIPPPPAGSQIILKLSNLYVR